MIIFILLYSNICQKLVYDSIQILIQLNNFAKNIFISFFKMGLFLSILVQFEES